MRSAVKLRFSSWKEMLKGKFMLVIGGVWILLGAFDLIKTEFFPTMYQEYTALRLLEYFSWKTWLIVLLLILIGIFMEGGHAALERRDKKWNDTRRGIEHTNSQIIREFSEKMELLRGELADEKAKQKAPNVHLEWKVLPQIQAGMGTHAFFLTNGGYADAFNVDVTFREMDGFSAIHKGCVNKISVGASEILLCYPMRVDANHKHSYLGGMNAAGLETLLTTMEQGNVYPTSELEITYKDFGKKDYADRFVVALDDPFGVGNSVTIRKL